MAKVSVAHHKPKSMPKGKISKIRAKAGMSGAYKHKSSSFAGPEHTFPIGDMAHARNALARAHYSANPGAIRAKVYAKFPGLKARHEKREHGKKEKK